MSGGWREASWAWFGVFVTIGVLDVGSYMVRGSLSSFFFALLTGWMAGREYDALQEDREARREERSGR